MTQTIEKICLFLPCTETDTLKISNGNKFCNPQKKYINMQLGTNCPASDGLTSYKIWHEYSSSEKKQYDHGVD